MKIIFLFCTSFFFMQAGTTQTDLPQVGGEAPAGLPYHQIPDYPEEYSAATVAARMVDGLGYRYYWATDQLRESDLEYKISPDSRSAAETLKHLYNLSETILNACRAAPNLRPRKVEEMDFARRRQKTLENFDEASQLLKASAAGEVEDFKIVFKRGEQTSDFPFWNLLNGPLADALYHVGQIVASRRASGNPLNPRVNVFTGKTRE